MHEAPCQTPPLAKKPLYELAHVSKRARPFTSLNMFVVDTDISKLINLLTQEIGALIILFESFFAFEEMRNILNDDVYRMCDIVRYHVQGCTITHSATPQPCVTPTSAHFCS